MSHTLKAVTGIAGIAVIVCGSTAQAQQSFEGNAVKQIRGKTHTGDATLVASSGLVKVAGADVSYNVTTGPDLFIVTFSAECQLRRAEAGADWVVVEARLDGVRMSPAAATNFAFCSAPHYVSASKTWMAGSVPNGPHTVEIFWQVIDGSDPTFNLMGRLDDWTLLLEVSN